jgi:hypothetical protein
MRLPRACRARRGFPHSPPPSEHPTPLQASRRLFARLFAHYNSTHKLGPTMPTDDQDAALTLALIKHGVASDIAFSSSNDARAAIKLEIKATLRAKRSSLAMISFAP